MASVALRSINKNFGSARVLHEVSLTVPSGEFLALVGPSGCGKSTTLRIIAGLETATSGDVEIDGRRVNDIAPKERDIGMVFQSYALYPHMSVRQNIAFGLTLRKLPPVEVAQRVDEVARTLELSSLLDRRPAQLSGGQRQRVAMGRAIARHPKVFLFDEPLSNLDAALRVQMRAELSALHRRLRTTMIYVTHDQVEAMTLASRIAVLDRGVMQQVDTPLALFHHPVNRFVAGFIGSPAMNFIDGRLTGAGTSAVFEGNGVRVSLDRGNIPRDHEPTTLGIRPHDVLVGSGSLRGEVLVVEQLGWDAFAHIQTSAGRIIARIHGDMIERVRAGDVVSVDLPATRVFLFGANGETRYSPRETSTASQGAGRS